MNRTVSNAFVLLAAMMLPVRLPMGECQGATLPAGAGDERSGEDHHVHPRHSHDHGHHHGHHHDQQPDGSKDSGKTTSPDEDSHHPGSPCACAPEDLPATVSQVSAVPKPTERFGGWVMPDTGPLRDLGYEVAIAAKPPPSDASGNLLALFQGNPCALLSRWVI